MASQVLCKVSHSHFSCFDHHRSDVDFIQILGCLHTKFHFRLICQLLFLNYLDQSHLVIALQFAMPFINVFFFFTSECYILMQGLVSLACSWKDGEDIVFSLKKKRAFALIWGSSGPHITVSSTWWLLKPFGLIYWPLMPHWPWLVRPDCIWPKQVPSATSTHCVTSTNHGDQ